jgi:hypothetical protein
MFDLEKFKAGRLAKTRNGYVAEFACHNPKAASGDRLGAYVGGDLIGYHEDGIFHEHGRESVLDLVDMIESSDPLQAPQANALREESDDC